MTESNYSLLYSYGALASFMRIMSRDRGAHRLRGLQSLTVPEFGLVRFTMGNNL